MKRLAKLYDALVAPFYAMLGISESWHAEVYHALVWLLIALGVTLTLPLIEWLGWPTQGLTRFTYGAWFAFLVLRLALVEHELAEMKKEVKT